MIKKYRALTVLFAVCLACCQKNAKPENESESESNIGNGVDWDHPSSVLLHYDTAMGAVQGSGTFAVKKRCVLTAGHVAEGLAMIGEGAVFASTIKGAAVNDARVAYDKVKGANVRKLKDSLPMASRMAQEYDMAFVWTNGTQNANGKRPAIHGKPGQAYDPVAIGYGHTPDGGAVLDLDDGTQYYSLGYGTDCINAKRGGIQRQGYSHAITTVMNTTGAIADVQVATEPTRVLTYSSLTTAPPARYRFCPGDSGAALEIYNTSVPEWQIVGVFRGTVMTNPTYAQSTLTKPYQPWLEDTTDKWCNPMHRVSVRPSNEFIPFSVTGVATTDVVTSSTTIIQCNGDPGDDCSQNCGGDETGCATFYEGHTFIDDHSDWLPATTGSVTLTANSVSGACFVGWRTGRDCPCEGWQPGHPFTSPTCVLQLHDTLQPDPEQTEDIWLNCNVDYVATSTGSMSGSCPPSPACYSGMCEPGESCTFGGGCGAYDCGSCDGYCGDRYCSAMETSTCADCTCGDGTCQGHEDCASCGYDCGDCTTCGDGFCDSYETNWCDEDCSGTCGDMFCDFLEDSTTCPGDCP